MDIVKRLPPIALLIVAVLGSTRAARADVIGPSALSGTEGDSNNAFPFHIGDFGFFTQRYQQVYDSAEFAGPMVISGLAFRPDADAGFAFSSTLPSIRIGLSTTQAGVDALSTTFADNVGADDAIVFNGALTLSSAFTGPVQGPKHFDIVIVFSSPFAYDPAAGNLLLDVRNFGSGVTTPFDYDENTGDTVSRVFGLGDDSVGEVQGAADTGGLVTSFQTVPLPSTTVPEPASVILVVTGLARTLLRRRR